MYNSKGIKTGPDIKRLESTTDRRQFTHKRTHRGSLSKKFKHFETLGIGRTSSLNLNLWLLTSKKKKKILFKTANKDYVEHRVNCKPQFTSNDFAFKTSK